MGLRTIVSTLKIVLSLVNFVIFILPFNTASIRIKMPDFKSSSRIVLSPLLRGLVFKGF